jgi:K+-transporting ATPase ATPase A chain
MQVAHKDAKGQVMQDTQGHTVMQERQVEIQTIVQGPMATQMVMRVIGTNGGGVTNANS